MSEDVGSRPDARTLVTAFAKDHKDIPEIGFINADPDGVHINDISGGNGLVNYIYQVRSADRKQSVILKYGEDTIRLFDWEFAFMSHPGQNVGFVVESYIMYHIITQSQDRDAASKAALQSQFVQAITLFLESYMKELVESGLPVTLSEIALFTGGSTFASSVYCGTEMFTNITAAGLLTLMNTGFRLMEQHKALTSVDKIISVIFNK